MEDWDTKTFQLKETFSSQRWAMSLQLIKGLYQLVRFIIDPGKSKLIQKAQDLLMGNRLELLTVLSYFHIQFCANSGAPWNFISERICTVVNGKRQIILWSSLNLNYTLMFVSFKVCHELFKFKTVKICHACDIVTLLDWLTLRLNSCSSCDDLLNESFSLHSGRTKWNMLRW